MNLGWKVLVPPHVFACLDAEGENYVVEVDLLGVKKKDIDLSMHEDIIRVLAGREDYNARASALFSNLYSQFFIL